MLIVSPNWRQWFAEMWPSRKHAVARDALTVGREHKLFLADMALRANVFAPIVTNDPIALAREEGKRQLALETIKLCNIDPPVLMAMLEQKPQPEQQRGTGR